MRNLLMTTAVAIVTGGSAIAATTDGGFMTETTAGDMLGSELLGKRLYASETGVDPNADAAMRAQWQDVGEIDDVLIGKDGEIKAVLLDIGGFLGIGAKSVAVDMNELRFVNETNADDYFVVFEADRSALEQAPAFEMSQRWMEQDGEMPGSDSAMNDTDRDALTEGYAARNETWTAPNIKRTGYVPVADRDLTAEMLEGAAVYGPNDENIGEVADLVVTRSGVVDKALVDVGGFLGIGEHRIAIDFDEVQVVRDTMARNDVRIHISASRQQLEQRPEYSG